MNRRATELWFDNTDTARKLLMLVRMKIVQSATTAARFEESIENKRVCQLSFAFPHHTNHSDYSPSSS
jgi:hypothetical protein